MNLEGLAARIFGGGTPFAALIGLGFVFLLFVAYMANGMTAPARRSAMFLVVVLSIIEAIAILAFLFPHLAAGLISPFSWLWQG